MNKKKVQWLQGYLSWQISLSAHSFLCWTGQTFDSESSQCSTVSMFKTLRVVTMDSLCAWSKEFVCFLCVFESFRKYLLCNVVMIVSFGEGLRVTFFLLLLFCLLLLQVWHSLIPPKQILCVFPNMLLWDHSLWQISEWLLKDTDFVQTSHCWKQLPGTSQSSAGLAVLCNWLKRRWESILSSDPVYTAWLQIW